MSGICDEERRESRRAQAKHRLHPSRDWQINNEFELSLRRWGESPTGLIMSTAHGRKIRDSTEIRFSEKKLDLRGAICFSKKKLDLWGQTPPHTPTQDTCLAHVGGGGRRELGSVRTSLVPRLTWIPKGNLTRSDLPDGLTGQLSNIFTCLLHLIVRPVWWSDS